MFQHSLNDSTTILMDTHLINSISEVVNHKLNFFTIDLFNNLLDNMVTICVIYEFIKSWFYLIYKNISLLWCENL